MNIRRKILRLLSLLGIFVVQLIVWQIALVQLAHIHSELNYSSAVGLLDNRPGLFYGIVSIALLVSNGLVVLWWKKRDRGTNSLAVQSQAPHPPNPRVPVSGPQINVEVVPPQKGTA